MKNSNEILFKNLGILILPKFSHFLEVRIILNINFSNSNSRFGISRKVFSFNDKISKLFNPLFFQGIHHIKFENNVSRKTRLKIYR